MDNETYFAPLNDLIAEIEVDRQKESNRMWDVFIECAEQIENEEQKFDIDLEDEQSIDVKSDATVEENQMGTFFFHERNF